MSGKVEAFLVRYKFYRDISGTVDAYLEHLSPDQRSERYRAFHAFLDQMEGIDGRERAIEQALATVSGDGSGKGE